MRESFIDSMQEASKINRDMFSMIDQKDEDSQECVAHVGYVEKEESTCLY
jgi:hypothetical protein